MDDELTTTFLRAHDGLPREAPGSERTTRLLLEMAGPLPPEPRILDIGCGTGPATLVLLAETGGTVDAVDLHEPYLATLRGRAPATRVRTLAAPMQDLPFPDGAFDLVWAEGSAYIMGRRPSEARGPERSEGATGFDDALASWRRLLAPGGVLVLTEAEWTTPDPAPGARAFWDEGYPAMRTTDANVRAALDARWSVAGTYLLPDDDWAAYYEPLAARIEQLRADGVDPGALHEVAREIGVRAAHGSDYGYTGYVLRPR